MTTRIPTIREWPIIFSDPMVRALRDGRKTQTRRLPTSMWNNVAMHHAEGVECRLWVREAWNLYHEEEDEGPERCVINYRTMEHDLTQLIPSRYEDFFGPADDVRFNAAKALAQRWRETWTETESWRPSIHMPRWASRITLKVEALKLERVQDIDILGCYEEAALERPKPLALGSEKTEWQNARREMRRLWDSLHTKPGDRWDDNPEIYAIKFRMLAR